MIKNRQETIADIVSEMRIGDLCASDTSARSMYINDFLTSYAYRILAAHKREIADEKRISDAVIQSLRDKKTGDGWRDRGEGRGDREAPCARRQGGGRKRGK